MLIYNIFIFTVAFLLYLDYVVHKNDVHLVNGGTRLSFGNRFMYLALVVIIFFAGFRFEIGYDYPKYLAGYLYDDELRHWEPFFNFFVRLIRNFNFGLDIQFMLLFFSTLTIITIYKALQSLTPYYRFGLLLYVLVPALYMNAFSVIRQGIALAILLYGLHFITRENPDYKKYILFAFLAFMFHYSSIFVAIIYIIGQKFFQRKYSWIVYSLFIGITLFLSFMHVGKYLLMLMPGHFSKYADMAHAVSPLKIIIVNMFFLFIMVQKDNFIKNKLEKYLFNSIFIGLLIFNVFSDFIYVSRLAQYFLVAELVLIPIYIYSIKDLFMRKVMFILLLFYYVFNFNYALYRDSQVKNASYKLIPYKNYFFEEQKSNRNLNIEAWYNYIQESGQEEENNK